MPRLSELPAADPLGGTETAPVVQGGVTKIVTLGTAAGSSIGAFATAAQGALADSALQPADVGTAAAEDVGAFATAAQGALADSAVQPAAIAARVERVVHGATAGTARPAVTYVEWVGSVEPANAVDGDTWVDTSA